MQDYDKCISIQTNKKFLKWSLREGLKISEYGILFSSLVQSESSLSWQTLSLNVNFNVEISIWM